MLPNKKKENQILLGGVVYHTYASDMITKS